MKFIRNFPSVAKKTMLMLFVAGSVAASFAILPSHALACWQGIGPYQYDPLLSLKSEYVPLDVTVEWRGEDYFTPYTLHGVYYPAPVKYFIWGDDTSPVILPYQECGPDAFSNVPYRYWPPQQLTHTYTATSSTPYCPTETVNANAPLHLTGCTNGAVWVTDPPPPLTLGVSKTGNGTGRVTSDVFGLDCGAVCSVQYPPDYTDNIRLTAAPDVGSDFKGWYWDGVFKGTSTLIVLPVTLPHSIVAQFDKMATPTVALTVTKSGTGAGTVTSNPTGLTCGTFCSKNFDVGTVVTLTATPNSTSTFTGWSGACSGTSTCNVTMSAAKTVNAVFTAKPAGNYRLTVNKPGAPTALGIVQTNPPGVYCKGEATSCNHDFPSGTSVTLYAYSSGDAQFKGWTGGCTGTSTSCTLTMNAAKTVAATFTKNPIGCPPGSKLSDASWTDLYQGNDSTASLSNLLGFRQNTEKFVAALKNAGAAIKILAAYRPPQRAYLMHYSWDIAKGLIDPRKVPMGTGINICWVHKNKDGTFNLAASRAAAQAMVTKYQMVKEAALASNHITGNAIDMTVSWSGTLNIKNASGATVSITTLPKTHMNPKLWDVSASYKVIKYGAYPGGNTSDDPGHWSTDGH